MEAVYYAARANFRRVLSQHPHWTRQQYAQAVGMSQGWVKKWRKRLREAPPEDEAVLHSQSRARQPPRAHQPGGGRPHPPDARSAPRGLGAHAGTQSPALLSPPR
ncbi:MAG TPA: hypothetical protein VIY29_22105 [Ktedonobacteraceae bacterium]